MEETPAAATSLITHPLAYIREAKGWSYQDLVDVIARRARSMGVPNMARRREKAWRWEHWGVSPDHITQLALAAELDVPREMVKLRPWPLWLASLAADLDGYAWSQAGTADALDATSREALLDRRGFLILSGTALAAFADQWLKAPMAQVMQAVEGNRVVPEVVASIEQRLPGLRVLEARLGGVHVRSLADAELRLVVALLSRASYSPDLGQRMFTVAAELGHVAGWASFDAGYHAAAQRYWTSALRAAHASSSEAVGANILKSMSLQALDLHNPRDALALAETACRGAARLRGRPAAMFVLREARAHAALGSARDCEASLSEAERLQGISTDDPEPGWAAYFDDQEYSAQVGTCYLELGDALRADEWLAKAEPVDHSDKVRDRVTYIVRRATAQLDLGAVDQACETLASGIPALSQTESARNQARVRRLLDRLSQWSDQAAVADVRDQLASAS